MSYTTYTPHSDNGVSRDGHYNSLRQHNEEIRPSWMMLSIAQQERSAGKVLLKR